MRKFENGDLVKLISTRKDDNSAGYIPEMEGFLGKTFIVEYCDEGYCINNNCIEIPCEPSVWYPGRILYDERCFRRIRKVVNVKQPKAVAPVKKAPKGVKENKHSSKLRKELTDKLGNLGSGTCSYAVAYKNGPTRFQIRDACHARLYSSYNGVPYEKKPVAVALHLKGHYAYNMHGVATSEAFKTNYTKYVDYIINRSPWASCFITKDVKDAIDNCASLDLNKPVVHLMGAAVALREASEFPMNFEIFDKALQEGFSEDVAYLLTTCLRVSGGVVVPILITNGHKVLAPNNPIDGIIKFFKQGYPDKGFKSYYEDGGFKNGINRYMVYPVDEVIPDKRFQNVVNNVLEIKPLAFGEISKPKCATPIKTLGDHLTKLFKEYK